MPDPVVLDTHIFNGSIFDWQPYWNVRVMLIHRCDRVLANSGILQEYVEMAADSGIPPSLIQEIVIPQLKGFGKWQWTGNRPVRVGPKQDRPFIGAALDGQARYLISNDLDFRRPSVQRILQEARIDVLSALEYLDLE